MPAHRYIRNGPGAKSHARRVIVSAVLASTGCGSATLSVDDTIVAPGRPVELHAYVHRHGSFGRRTYLEDREVMFRVGGRELKGADMHKDGRLCAVCAAPTESVTVFQARARVEGREMTTTGRIFIWQPKRPCLVCDIDGTISQTDFVALVSNPEDDGSKPFPGSVEHLTGLAREFPLVYVTQRPHTLLAKTRTWLDRWKLPIAPVITSDRLQDLASASAYKTRVIADLKAEWPNILIGIGDEPTDAIAYGENVMLSIIVNEHPSKPYAINTLKMRDWDAIAEFFRSNQAILGDPHRLALVAAGREKLLIAANPHPSQAGRGQ